MSEKIKNICHLTKKLKYNQKKNETIKSEENPISETPFSTTNIFGKAKVKV